MATAEEELLEDSEESLVEEVFENTIDPNILEPMYSFGYDCKRLYNMILIDDDTIVFASGTFIHYFSISLMEVTFRESSKGSGIGFITKNYNEQYQGMFTVGENGTQPTVTVYEYPSHDVVVELTGGAKQSFTCGSYNHTGELLATQAGYPDFMLTIWRWQTAEIILRSKAFQNDVLYVHFSRFNPILLVSCGLSHIKFWKMANTFTGLKLQGDLGRFGKTDFSDIYAVHMLADENVISGCEWGNMLLWEAGLIKFEITRKGRKPCHTKPIVSITMSGNEVMTAGMDGYIRVWLWDPIDVADPPDDDRYVETEPIHELSVGNCEIRMLQKIYPFDDTHTGHYALDGHGGIWFFEMDFTGNGKPAQKIYTCHGGKVISAQVSPLNSYLMTLGEDSKLCLYNYEERELVLQRHLRVPAMDIVWFSEKISPSGMEIVVCSIDGVLRHYYIEVNTAISRTTLHLIRPIKGHTAAINCITIDPNNNVLVTGSMDHTIFLYALNEKGPQNDLIHFRPLGFVQFTGIPNCFCWKFNTDVLLIGCKSGEVYQYPLPKRVSEEQTYLSYNLTDRQEIKYTKFVSVKSTIRRDLKRAATKKRKDKKRRRKLKNIEKLKANNPGLQIDMEQALADSEPDEEEEPLFIPPVPNPILWLRYTNRETIWVSMGGYDAGYIYELVIGETKPYRSTIIADGDDIEIYTYLIVENYLLFGLMNGKLRLNLINPDDFTDLRDYHLIGTHDPMTGCISKILLSSNSKFLFTVGFDGNIFVYLWSGPTKPVEESKPIKPKAVKVAADIASDHPSLEQEKIIAEQKRKDDAAMAHETKVLNEIARLQEKFNKIYNDNLNLPEDMRIPHKEMLLDERITKQILGELQFELDDVRDDLAYDLEVATVGRTKLYDYFIKKLDFLVLRICGLGSDISVYSFRLEKLDDEFYQLKEELEERLREEALRRAAKKFEYIEEKEESVIEEPEETFFFGRNPDTIIPRFSKKMLRLLNSYRLRRAYDMERIHDWEKLQKAKPDPNRNHPDDEREIENAAAQVGDYKLKTGADYEPAAHETLCFKYHEIVSLRERLYEMQHRFNEGILQLRESKKIVQEKINRNLERLKAIHAFIPESSRKYCRKLYTCESDDEYPELNLIEHVKAGCGIEIKDILFLEKRVQDLLPKPKRTKYQRPNLKMGEFDMAKTLGISEVQEIPEGNEFITMINALPDYTDPRYLDSMDDKPSPWAIEMRYGWLLTLIVQQNAIIEKIDQDVSIFDSAVREMMAERLLIKYEDYFLIAYMMALNQELYILRDSEQIENQLLFNADNALAIRNQAANAIKVLTRQIEDLRKQCDRLNDQISAIQTKFMANCKGHKFFDFLRRIFKKKWRPPKPPKGEDESSESSDDDESSSEEEEGDTKSIDSNDVTAIRLDETHCPPGLERSMYEYAFKLRSDRHELERGLLEAAKQIEAKRLEVKQATINVSHHTDVYNRERDALISFRRKRQQEINKIYVTVALRMSQIQHFREGEDYCDISEAVLFDADRLVQLKSRASILEDETIKTHHVYRRNIVHLRRMKIDLKFMNLESKRLQAEINEEMMRKFGMIIELDELEEEVLRKYIFELETTADEEIADIVAEMKRKKAEIALAQEELIRETQLNCDKQNVLSVLLEEKTNVGKMLQDQRYNYLKWLKPTSPAIDHDIEKLMAVHREQQATIKCLEEEIASLKIMGRSTLIDNEAGGDGPRSTGQQNAESGEQGDESIPPTCLEMLDVKAYDKRLQPDDFVLDRAFRIVQKLFTHRFNSEGGPRIQPEELRRFTGKVSRYLSQVAYTLDGEFTEMILDCLLENLSLILPKKYLITLNRNDVMDVFNEIHGLFDFESSKLNYSEIIAEFYEQAGNALQKRSDILNPIQFKLVYLFKQLIETLPYDEFLKKETIESIVKHLMNETPFDGRCISVENLIAEVVKYAEKNALYSVSVIPIRTLAEGVSREYIKQHLRRGRSTESLSQSSRSSITSMQ